MKNLTNDITQETAWKKTSQFINEKYGKKIEFRTLAAASGDVARESSRVSYFSQGDDLVVPLKYKQAELGQVIVCRGANLTFDQQLETVDLIQFLIEPQIYNRMLKLQINAYDPTEAETGEKSTNVINLFSTPIEIDNKDKETSLEDNRRRLVSKFIHIRAKSSMARHKVAYKIHEMTGTIVFLRLQDLTDGTSPVTHEMDLSETAIYVDNLQELNPNQFDLLEKMSRQNLKGNCVIIVGSSLSEDEVHHLDCTQAMKNDLLALSYDADRVPVSQQASEEILDLLFFNDDDIIS